MAFLWLQFPDAAPFEFIDSIRRLIDDVIDWEYNCGQPIFDITGNTTIADSDSTQYLHVLVNAINEFDLSLVDLTEDNTVLPFITFLSMPEEPRETTIWYDANWLVQLGAGSYYARIEIGPDTEIQLLPGDYSVWIKIKGFQGRAGIVSFI